MQLKGIIEKINDEINISDTFKKREFVIDAKDENSQYDNFVKFELVQHKCDLVNDFKVGDKVIVDFDINGRKWVNPKGEEVFFNSLKAWKIIPADESAQQSTGQGQDNAQGENSNIESTQGQGKKDPEWLKDDNTSTSANNQDDDDNDLPF